MACNEVELDPKRSEIKAAWPHIRYGSLPGADSARASTGLNDSEENEDFPQFSHLLFSGPKDANLGRGKHTRQQTVCRLLAP